jgi:hypothetical protein
MGDGRSHGGNPNDKGALDWADGIFRISFILFWVLLAFWVYRDAQQRGANAVAWGILTLVSSVLGWSVYMIARPRGWCYAPSA